MLRYSLGGKVVLKRISGKGDGLMDKSTAEKFQIENRPVWMMGAWTALPVKARIVKICKDGCAGEYAEVAYICDDESVGFGSENVCFDSMYESKEELEADVFRDILKRTAEIKAAVQTKDDCIRFMFSHAVADTAECTDWVARRAIQKSLRGAGVWI